MKQIAFFLTLLAAFVAPDSLWAQTSPAAHAKTIDISSEKRFYRLEFTVKQMEGGRVINSRDYSVMLAGQQRSSMRSGARIPFKHDGILDYLNVGLDIDCGSAIEVDGQLSLHLKTELSSLAGSAASSPTASNSAELFTLRHNSWESDIIFPLRKATVIFSSDDLASKQNVQLEVLAIPIK